VAFCSPRISLDQIGAQKGDRDRGRAPTATTIGKPAIVLRGSKKRVSGQGWFSISHRAEEEPGSHHVGQVAGGLQASRDQGALNNGPSLQGVAPSNSSSHLFRPVTLAQPCGFLRADKACWPHLPTPVVARGEAPLWLKLGRPTAGGGGGAPKPPWGGGGGVPPGGADHRVCYPIALGFAPRLPASYLRVQRGLSPGTIQLRPAAPAADEPFTW